MCFRFLCSSASNSFWLMFSDTKTGGLEMVPTAPPVALRALAAARLALATASPLDPFPLPLRGGGDREIEPRSLSLSQSDVVEPNFSSTFPMLLSPSPVSLSLPLHIDSLSLQSPLPPPLANPRSLAMASSRSIECATPTMLS